MRPLTKTSVQKGAARLRAIRPLEVLGGRLILRQLEQTLRFRESDRFGHEFPDRRRFFRHAFHYLTFNGIKGDYAEFGSFGGYTFRLAWSAAQLARYGCHLWAFDSFEGLPASGDRRDEHPRWLEGTMSTSVMDFHRLCQDWGMDEDDYTAIAGYYSSTLIESAEGERPTAIAFAHVDCDLYSSTVEVLRFLEPRLRTSSIIAFDDYYCYSPDGPSGERAAAREHFQDSQWSLVPYIQYGWAGMSFVVERRDQGEQLPIASW